MTDPLPMFDGGEGDSSPVYRVSITGKDKARWAEVREKVLKLFEDCMNVPSPAGGGATVGDELRSLMAGALEAAKAKLAMPGAQLASVEAEAAERFAEAKRRLAEARKLSAEAERIEQATYIKNLYLRLSTARIMIQSTGDGGEDAVMLGNQIEQFLIVVKDLHRDFQALPPGRGDH